MSNNRFTEALLSDLYRNESRKVLATLIRLLGDMDLAEEAMHEALAVALEVWPENGVPDNPSAWLISTGRFKAIDILRQRSRWSALQQDGCVLAQSLAQNNAVVSDCDIEDDQLRLIFACCHPAIDRKVQVPLTLREVCGLTTEEIANAFLVSSSALAQRIVRGKNAIRADKIPFAIPERKELPERLDAVLSVIYLVFNEGYSASGGDAVTRVDLSNEAIRLAKSLLALLPDPEVMGLLALMLLHESRRRARTDAKGDIVLLEDQDRTQWDQSLIQQGATFIREALASGQLGFYTLQAAISAAHAEAPSAEQTDWDRIVGLYGLLMQVNASPVIELNRAVAIAMRDGPSVGLACVDAILARGKLKTYHLIHTTRGELLRRRGDLQAALLAFKTASTLAKQAPEKRLIAQRIEQILGQLP